MEEQDQQIQLVVHQYLMQEELEDLVVLLEEEQEVLVELEEEVDKEQEIQPQQEQLIEEVEVEQVLLQIR